MALDLHEDEDRLVRDDGVGQFRRGFRSSAISGDVGAAASDWFKAKRDNDLRGMQSAAAKIEALKLVQEQTQPRINDIRNIRSLRDAADWTASSVGQAIQSTTLPILGGIAGAAIGGRVGAAAGGKAIGSAIGGALGAGSLSYNLEANEAAANSYVDDTIRNDVDPNEVISAMRKKGAINAVLESAIGVGGGIGGRIANRGVTSGALAAGVRPGLVAGIAHTGRMTVRGAAEEAGTEVLQEGTGMHFQSELNPERDTSGDTWQLINAGASGAAGGGVLHTPATFAELHAAQQARPDDLTTLMRPPKVPPNLSDEELVQWDDDNRAARLDAGQRLSSNPPPELQGAAEVFRKLRSTDPDIAIASFADSVKKAFNLHHDGLDLDGFLTTMDELNEMAGRQMNAEHEPSDIIGMRNLTKWLKPNSHLLKDDAKRMDVYDGLKDMLINDPERDLPIQRLATAFGGEDRLVSAIDELKAHLEVTGELTAAESQNAERLKLKLAQGMQGDAKAITVMKAFDPEFDEQNRDHRRTALELSHRLQNYGALDEQKREEVENAFGHLFGKNQEKAIEAMGGRRELSKRDIRKFDNESVDMANDSNPEGEQQEATGADESFHGRVPPRNAAEDESPLTKAGGFFNTHYVKASARKDAEAMMADRKATLEAQGHTVTELNPAQFVERTGMPARSVAKAVGVDTSGKTDKEVMDALREHGARILHSETATLDTDSVDVGTKDINDLAEKAKKFIQIGARGQVASKEKAALVQEGLALRLAGKGREAFQKLKEAGFPHAVSMQAGRGEGAGKMFVTSNLAHGGAGRLVVRMRDGTEHVLSAQDLVNHMYGKQRDEPVAAKKPNRRATQGRMFAQAIAGLTANKDVAGVYTVDYKGVRRTADSIADSEVKKYTFDEDGNKRDLTPKQFAKKREAHKALYGAFGQYFPIATHKGRTTSLASAAWSNTPGVDDGVSEGFLEKIEAIKASMEPSKDVGEMGNDGRGQKILVQTEHGTRQTSTRAREEGEDPTRIYEQIEHLYDTAKNAAEIAAVDDLHDDFGENLSEEDNKRLEKLSNRKKALSEELEDELDDLQTREATREQVQIAKQKITSAVGGLTPDAQTTERGGEKAPYQPHQTLQHLSKAELEERNRRATTSAANALVWDAKGLNVPKMYEALRKIFKNKYNALNSNVTQGTFQKLYDILAKATIDNKENASLANQARVLAKAQGEFNNALIAGMKELKQLASETKEEALKADYRKMYAELQALGKHIAAHIDDSKPSTSQATHADGGMAVLRQKVETYDEAVAKLRTLNRLIAMNDGTPAQMKLLNVKAGEVAALVESLRPAATTPDTDTLNSRKRLAEIKRMFQLNEEEEGERDPAAGKRSAELKEQIKLERPTDHVIEAAKGFIEAKQHFIAMFDAVADALHAKNFDKELADVLITELRSAYKAVSKALPHVGKYVQRLIRDYQAALKAGTPSPLRATFAAERERLSKKLGLGPPSKGMSRVISKYVKMFDGEFTTGFEASAPRTYAGYASTSVLTRIETIDGGTAYGLYIVPKEYYTQLLRKFLRDNGLVMKTMTKAQKKLVDPAFREWMAENWAEVDDIGMYHVWYGSTGSIITNGPTRSEGGSHAHRSFSEAGEVTDDNAPNITGELYSKMTAATAEENFTAFGELAARVKAATGESVITARFFRDTGANPDDSEMTVVQLNEAEESAEAASKLVPLKTRKEVEDYIAKVLGPSVTTQFVKSLGGARGMWERTKNGDALISIISRTANPMTIGHHEAMHEFFQRLMDTEPEMAAILEKASSSAAVIRQLEQFFHKSPKALKAIADKTPSGKHERVAYMFQAWAAPNGITVGPATETLFQKIIRAFKKAFGIIQNDAHAEQIMELFHDGKLSVPSDMATVLAEDSARRTAYGAQMLNEMNPLYEQLKYLIGTAHGQTAGSSNPHISWIGKQFFVGTGEKTNELGFLSEKVQKTNQMLGNMRNIFAKLDDNDMKLVLEGLQTRQFSSDPKILAAQNAVDRMLDRMHAYMTLNKMTVTKRANYFPRAWDSEHIGNYRTEFINDLKARHLPVLERIAKRGRYENGKHVKSTVDGVAARIADVLIKGRGADPIEENLWELGYAPYMEAKHARKLDWIDDKHFAKYYKKDAVDILTSYIGQAVHNAEYTRRFGEKGEVLEEKLREAADWELKNGGTVETRAAFAKAVKELDAAFTAAMKTAKSAPYPQRPDLQAYIAEADKIMGTREVSKFLESKLRFARKQIMAMEGTLGFDISERMRKIQGNLIVYENLRTMWTALFSNLVDPLGTMVHGGSLEDAFGTLKLGLTGVVNGWRGKEMTGPAMDLARAFGTIDASHMLNTMGQVYSSVYNDKRAKWLNDHLFRWNGVEGLGQANRAGATVAAVNLIKRIRFSKNEHDVRLLEELYGTGYDPKAIAFTAAGELDPVDKANQRAVFKWVDRAMLRPNAAMRPAYGSDGHYAIIFHLKQFTYAFHKVMLEHVLKEGKHGNYEPAMIMLAGYVPMMIMADMLKDLLVHGGEPPWKKKWKAADYLQNGIERAGLLGVPQLALDTAKWGPAELAGPFAGQIAQGVRTFRKDIALDEHLDDRAALTGRQKDIDKALAYHGTRVAARKTLRDALPASPLFKRHIFDAYEPKIEKALSQ